MVKRLCAALLAALLLIPGITLGDMEWKEDTPAQVILRNYIELANAYLPDQGETEINTLFEMYNSFAVLGITAEPDAEIPEGVEITVSMLYDSLNSLELRVNSIDRFPGIAAALINALYGEGMSAEDALRVPAERTKKAKNEPENSFEEEVEELNGTVPRFYYAYYPNQYRDGVSWMQMTIIFPLAGTWDGTGMITGDTSTKAPDTESGVSEDYEGYYSRDDYEHFETFLTPTPEPDSAAAEYDFR
ncbi:MAG: hypothetical protein K6E17_07285 [Clostridiales bacterium]|nr:hypothetical protein [Clostridiales bacterium]